MSGLLPLITWWLITGFAILVAHYWIRTSMPPDPPYEEVEPAHLGGTRRLDANDHPSNREHAA